MALGRDIFRLSYEISPIILVNGVASLLGGMLPIIAITEAANFTLGLLNGTVDINLDDYFAHFRPLPGATLIDNQIGSYPFANQAIAANAIIAQPLRVSMLMSCPVRAAGGYTAKLATMTALQMTLAAHNNAGGTYTVATPSQLYTNLVMTGMRDVSNGGSKQAQTDWQLDFEQPLISTQQAQTVYSALMGKIASGLQTTDLSWSGLANSVGNTLNGVSTSIIPAMGNMTGAVAVPSAVQNAASIPAVPLP